MEKIDSAIAKPVLGVALHAIGDAVGGLLEFVGIGGESDHEYVVHVSLLNTSNLTPDLRLFLFPERVVVAADNAALDLSAAAEQRYFHVIDITAADWKSAGGGVQVAAISNLVLPVIGDKGRIYGQLQAVTAAYTPVAADELSVSVFTQVL